MNDTRSLLVGYDLCDDFTQISVYNRKGLKADTISLREDEEQCLIPTVLAVKEDTKEWFYGEEAIRLVEREEGVLVPSFVNKLGTNEETSIYQVNFKPEALLEKFFRKTLSILKIHYPNDSILQLVITVKNLDHIVLNSIYAALEKMGLQKDRVSIISHAQSFIYYALSQKKELWLNDIALFDFDRDGLNYYQISLNRKTTPIVVGTLTKDFSSTLPYELIAEQVGDENIGYIFENIARNVLHKQIISTIYLTGVGFQGEWANSSIQEFCIGRRVFKGMNLYSKGACYAANELKYPDRFRDFALFSEEMIGSSISYKLYVDTKIREVEIVKATTPWYEVNNQIEVILDDQEELEVIVKDMFSSQKISYILAFTGLPERPNKMTRMLLDLKSVSKNCCILQAKDLGFGSYYPSSNRIWELNITLDNLETSEST